MNSATDPFFPKPGKFVQSEAGQILLQLIANNDMPPIRVGWSPLPARPLCFDIDQFSKFVATFSDVKQRRVARAWAAIQIKLGSQNTPCN